MIERNAIDTIIGYFSPEAGLRRVLARTQVRAIFDGAGTQGRLSRWNASSAGPKTETKTDRATLVNRSRDMMRNDGWAQRARDLISSYTVGTGMRLTVLNDRGQKDPALQMVFDSWAESLNVSVSGKLNLRMLERLAMRSIFTSGEILIARDTPRNPADWPAGIPLRLQILECDYLDTLRDNDSNILQGIEFDGQRPTAYWLYKNAPNDSIGAGYGMSERVLADDILHVFDMERAGQIRGIPWLAPALVSLRDLGIYQDAELMRRKIAACMAAFITSAPNMQLSEAEQEAFQKLDPGSVSFLQPGQDVKFSNPPTMNDYPDYIRTELQKVAASVGTTYEYLSGNLKDVNFSSARIGQLPFKKLVKEWQELLFISQVIRPIWEWFKFAAQIGDRPQFANAQLRITPPAIDMLDVQKETDAAVTKVRSGFSSLSEIVREMGKDPDEVLNEAAEDASRLDRDGLILDTDPRSTTKAGIKQIEVSNA